MTWIEEVEGATAMERVLAQRPELLARFKAFYKSFWEDGLVSRRVLELCRLRIAAIHDCPQEWGIRDAEVALTEPQMESLRSGDLASFDPAERAALELAERVPYQHHQLTDEEVAHAERLLGAQGTVSLLTALAFFDVVCRLRLTLELDEESAVLASPPLADGAMV
jgi:alkylhydroperoxidase family enzyme